MILIEGRLIKTDRPSTHRLHRVNRDTDTYFTAALLLTDETEADFEEVKIEDIPAEEPSEE